MSSKTSGGFTADERAAMKERAKEAKAQSRRMSKEEKAAEAAKALLEKIAEMPDADRVLAEKVHELVTTSAPNLAPKTWYGMHAYALDDKIVCFFQSAAKFDARYATLGFNDVAKLDDGDMWATSFALKEITAETEARITDLVKKAVS
jgi:uncharacterized protein YdhG (YjbR/CyaY superfamily)